MNTGHKVTTLTYPVPSVAWPVTDGACLNREEGHTYFASYLGLSRLRLGYLNAQKVLYVVPPCA
jgi:hypothetical protein